MKRATLFIAALLLLGGCVADQVDAGKGLGSTSTHRQKKYEDGEKEQMCQDTSIGGQSKTVCY